MYFDTITDEHGKYYTCGCCGEHSQDKALAAIHCDALTAKPLSMVGLTALKQTSLVALPDTPAPESMGYGRRSYKGK